MTFEEIHDKILAGGCSKDIAEATECGRMLTTYGGKSQQMFAVVLHESKSMFDGNESKWASWATAEFHLKSANNTHHIRQIGEILCKLREVEFPMFQRFLSTSMSKLAELYEIYLAKGINGLINFVNLNFPDDSIEREDLRKAKAALLQKEKPEQLTLGLKFDVVREMIDETALEGQVRAKGFSEEAALAMGTNGSLLCHAAVRYIAENHTRIEQEAKGEARLAYLTWLHDQEQTMRDAADALRALAEKTTTAIQEGV